MLADPTVAPDVRAVAPTSSTSTALTANGTNWTTSVVGTTPDWLQVRARSVASGRMFTEAELTSVQPEVVLGSTTADELFGVRDPVGQTVTIGAQPFTVIGVLDTVGSTVGGDQDDQAIVPATTYATLVSPSSGTSVSTIYLEATSPDTLSAAYQEATNALLTTHGVTADRRGLQHQQPGVDRRDRDQHLAHPHRAARRHRGDLAARRRHRRHEHHARLGHRADPRDRPAQGARRDPADHPPAVPHRGHRARA